MHMVEALWSDMQGWDRRVREYLEDLERIMNQLGIPLAPPGGLPPTTRPGTQPPPSPRPNIPQPWHDSTADYQFLHTRLRDLRDRTESLNSAVTSLASIAGNRQNMKEQHRSIREAKSTKSITLLGLVFIPMAYTAAVFDMAEPYGPGGERFYEYFVWSVPLILGVVVAYYVLEFGYNDKGTGWSGVYLRRNLRRGWMNLRGRGRGEGKGLEMKDLP